MERLIRSGIPTGFRPKAQGCSAGGRLLSRRRVHNTPSAHLQDELPEIADIAPPARRLLKRLRQNQPRDVMWKCFSRRPAPNPTDNPETIRRRLQAAQLLIRARKVTRTGSAIPVKAEGQPDRRREILPSDEPDAIIPCRALPPKVGGSTLAAALESILQGKRVDAAIFTQLFRGGFVFKDPCGKWAITALGKELIEKHKLLTPEGCLVAGVKCAADWNR